MAKKQRQIAISVTTEEAMLQCISQHATLFCIENPLYTKLHGQLCHLYCLRDHDFQEYPEKQVILLTKTRGDPRFDAENRVPFYLPLSWEGWHS